MVRHILFRRDKNRIKFAVIQGHDLGRLQWAVGILAPLLIKLTVVKPTTKN